MPAELGAIDRPLRLRARPDVLSSVVPVPGGGRSVVTDPVTRDHFELTAEEHAILVWLDGRTTLRELQRKFDRQFAPQRVAIAQLWQYLNQLHADGLAISVAARQGDELWRRQQRRQREERLWAWTRVLAIRLPVFGADRFITALYRIVGWVFHPAALLGMLMLVLTAAWVAIANASRLAADLPTLATLTEPRNLLWLAATAISVKVLHELGHALACKHFGGEVREMGVLLLAFAPCLYCDVSDMWRLPSKAKRLAVSAAGMATELVLAAMAVLVWSAAQPGVVQSLAVGVVVVCTIGTLLVNANPLLRYDGYYLLADLTGVSNLWQRSREAVRDRINDWLFRPSPSRGKTAAKKTSWKLAAYGLMSQAYVLSVLTMVLWLVMATLKPLRLESVAWMLSTVCVAAVAAGPARQATRWARDPAGWRRLRRGRATATAVAVALVATAILRAPWTYTVETDAVAVLEDAQPVVTTLAGRLVDALPPGERVAAGDVVARLENPDLQLSLLDLQDRAAAQRLVVEQVQASRVENSTAGSGLPTEKALLVALEEQLAELQQDAERLVLRASRDGVVVAPPRINQDADETQDESTAGNPYKLSQWTGSPLDAMNSGAWIEPGTLICLVSDPQRVALQAALAEADIERLSHGQTARIAMNQSPGVVVTGRVVEIARDAIRNPPTEPSPRASLQNWSPLDPPSTAPGARYRVRIALDAPDVGFLVGGGGRVKIDTGRTSFGRWIADGFRQTFRLP